MKQFKITSLEIDKNLDGSDITTFYLKDEITKVIGSQQVDGRYLVCYGVKQIKVHDNYAAEIDINQKETIIQTDLHLDVSKRGEVWFTKQSFKETAYSLTQDHKDRRFAKMVERMKKTEARNKEIEDLVKTKILLEGIEDLFKKLKEVL